MKLLYIGDVMGRPGREVVAKMLPQMQDTHRPDIVLAQAENVTHGKGMSVAHYHELKNLGVNGFMSGNHIFEQGDIVPLLKDPQSPITRPANYPEGTAGMRYKILECAGIKLGLVSILGQIVGKDADVSMDNPIHVIDKVLAEIKDKSDAIVVNFHGDYSSEKVVFGQYLDGRVAAVIGDHWHVPTADGRLLPRGTAHISDVGMVGTLNSSLGVDTDTIVARWKGEAQGRNHLSTQEPFQFCAFMVDFDARSGLATGVDSIVEYIGSFA